MQNLGDLNALVIVAGYRLLQSYVQNVDIFGNASMFQTVFWATKAAKVLWSSISEVLNSKLIYGLLR